MTSSFSLLPLGGVGEIGSNMNLLRFGEHQLVIDCGLLFPYEDFFDINYLIPDFSVIDPGRLAGLVITHGHEDHIGAVWHFLQQFPSCPVYASRFTIALLRRKLGEHHLTPQFIEYDASSELKFPGLSIHPIHMTHSIPETFGLLIGDAHFDWCAFYASDFKFDLAPSFEAPFAVERLKKLAGRYRRKGFFIDSTNVLLDVKTPSEDSLHADLDALIAGSHTRIFLTLFASNVHRLNRICGIAKQHGRRVVAMGRSIEGYVRAGLECGLMDSLGPDELLTGVQGRELSSRLLVLVSGCQGDFQSALRRLAAGEDASFKLRPDDLVVFSSKVIPGNEKKVGRIVNAITELGCEVVTAYDADIHASGHPGKKDIAALLSHLTPDVYFPIHGESFFLRRHADWMRAAYPSVDTRVIHNWDEVTFADKVSVRAHEVREPHLIHGNGQVIERSQISQRRKLATQGVVFISVDRKRNILEISTQGLPLAMAGEEAALAEFLTHKLSSDLGKRDIIYAKDQLRIAARQFYQARLGYRPIAEVHLLN